MKLHFSTKTDVIVITLGGSTHGFGRLTG